MRSWPFCLACFFAFPAAAQTPIVQHSDPVNLRNLAVNNDGSEVIYVASRNRFAEHEGLGNIYSTVLTPQPTTTRLTSYKDDDSYLGVTALDVATATGKIVYSLLADFLKQGEDVRLIDGDGDRVIASDTEGCVRIACVNCYSTCIRNVHITADGNTVLYAAARNQPFTVVTVTPGTRKKLDVYDGALAPSGQRVISQAGRVVFTSSAPFGPTFAAQATDVYTMNLDGTGIQQVTHFDDVSDQASHAVIAANGSWIAFAKGGRLGAGQVWVVKPDGSGLHPISLAATGATGPSISADGSIVTFLQDGQVKQAPTAIDPLVLYRVVDITKFAVSAAQNAVITPDGKRAIFMLGPPSGLPVSIYSAPVAGVENFEQLTPMYTPRFLFTSGVVSAGGTAAPSVGSLMTAYGANLSTQEFSQASSLPLPTRLGGIELLGNLEKMPLQAVTPWQINAQLSGSRFPEGMAFVVLEGTTFSKDARADVTPSAPEAISMAAVSQPGLLLAAAVYPGTKTLANAARPAAAGETLEIYCFGLGATDPAVEVGAASPSPPARAKVTPRLQIGGRDAEISFAGLVPGLAGVYQVNAKVPTGLTPGYQPLRWIASDGSESGTSGVFVR